MKLPRIPRRSPKDVITKFVDDAIKKVESGGPYGSHLIVQLKCFRDVSKQMGWVKLNNRLNSAIENALIGRPANNLPPFTPAGNPSDSEHATTRLE